MEEDEIDFFKKKVEEKILKNKNSIILWKEKQQIFEEKIESIDWTFDW